LRYVINGKRDSLFYYTIVPCHQKQNYKLLIPFEGVSHIT